MSVRVRYAPSPTGSPHVGNLRTALFDWLFARRHGGAFIARLEDTDRDPARYRPECIADIEESLRFLGIVPDEWWVSGGPHAPYRQSERLDRYRAVADELTAVGAAYRCYCTPERIQSMREEQLARGAPTGYDRRCRSLSERERREHEELGHAYVVRQAMPLEGRTTFRDVVYGEVTVENRNLDDHVLLKSNGWPTYHLAAQVDDRHMAITHVIRGEDWLPSAPKHALLYRSLGWPEPVWVHVPLLLGTDRKKLGKRHGATQFVDFIRAGYLPEALFNFLALLGWSPGEEREIFSVQELIERFSLEAISRNPAIFDYEKLRWMNSHYLRQCAPERLVELCVPYLSEAGLVHSPPTADESERLLRSLPLAVERMRLLPDVVDVADYFLRDPEKPEEKGQRKWLAGPEAAARLDAWIRTIENGPDVLTVETAEAAANNVAEALHCERAPVIHTARVAVTGRTVGPGLFDILAVLGKETVARRLERARAWLIHQA